MLLGSIQKQLNPNKGNYGHPRRWNRRFVCRVAYDSRQLAKTSWFPKDRSNLRTRRANCCHLSKSVSFTCSVRLWLSLKAR